MCLGKIKSCFLALLPPTPHSLLKSKPLGSSLGPSLLWPLRERYPEGSNSPACGSPPYIQTSTQTHLCTPRPWIHTFRSRSERGGLGAAILLRGWRLTRWARRYWRWGRGSPGWQLRSEPSQWLSERWPATAEKRRGWLVVAWVLSCHSIPFPFPLPSAARTSHSGFKPELSTL